jgi:predicted MFS family arabinose efflux permease
VAGLSITETVSWGILYYGFPVMLRPMEVDLGYSRVQLTGALSIGLLTSALIAIPVGRWIDRHGARGVMTLGSCLATVLLLGWSRIESLGALYAVWALMGLAMAATLYEPAFAAVVGWFPLKDRDRALLIVTLVAALASTIFMPFEAWLVNRLGWRGALSALALILAVPTIPLHALVLRRPPRASARDRASGPDAAVPGLTLGAAAKTGVFWVLALAFLASNFTTNTVTVHLIPYLSDRGYSPTLAAAMIGWMGAMQLPARLVFGPITARFGHGAVTAMIFFVQAAALVQLALAGRLATLAPRVIMLAASLVLAGTGVLLLTRRT